MPATSVKQQHLFGMAYAIKKGAKIKTRNPAARRIANTLSASKIKEFAATRGLKK